MDTKKVGKNLQEILTKKFDFSPLNTIMFLGNMAKMALHAGNCLNQNVVLILESTNALGSLSNVLSSTFLLYELHNDTINTAQTFTKQQQNELLNQTLGGKRKHIKKSKTKKH
jgi:hypothetical protein